MRRNEDDAGPVKLLSIVTIHLDDWPGLGRTMGSLKNLMATPQVEWLVIDGGSRTESSEEQAVLKTVKERASVFFSEKDQGRFDAMNKGAGLAQGRYVQFLNAGDQVHTDFQFERLLEMTRKRESPDMIWGQCEERYPTGEALIPRTRSARWAWYAMPVAHPSVFFRRDLLGEQPYDLGLTIAADYDLLCRLLRSGARPKLLNSPVSVFHLGGISDVNHRQTLAEECKVRRRHYPMLGWTSIILVPVKLLLKRVSGNAGFRKLWRRWV